MLVLHVLDQIGCGTEYNSLRFQLGRIERDIYDTKLVLIPNCVLFMRSVKC
jgi:hypothetical protein